MAVDYFLYPYFVRSGLFNVPLFCTILDLSNTKINRSDQRCVGNEKFPVIPIFISGNPGNSGNGNEKSQNLRHSRNSRFLGNGNEFPLEFREYFFFQLPEFDFLNNKYFLKVFIIKRKNFYFI